MAAASNEKHNTNYNDLVECSICLEDINELKCEVIKCSCGNTICISCAKECLLTSDKDPHCIECMRGWDREFQYNNFGSKWINNKYKKYRKQLLLDREKARLPETQPIVEEYLKCAEYKEQIESLKVIRDEYFNKYSEISKQIMSLENKCDKIKRGEFSVKEKRKFVKKCPNNNCRGYLSSSYKCDLCSIHVCSKCHEIKGFTRNEEHTCNDDNIKTVEMLKKETKPCPSCATLIYKIDGCNQMWCTQCKVAFSWSTGRIENGVIHNPHYYEWMQNNNNGNIQNPGTVVCGGVPDYYNMRFHVFNKINSVENIKLYNTLTNLHRSCNHNLYTVIDTLRNSVNGAINNTDLRIRFLANEIDEKHFAKIITQRDNIREKKIAMLDVLELYNTICVETINQIYAYAREVDIIDEDTNIEKINERIEYLYKAVLFCNKRLMNIAKNYKMKVYVILKEQFYISGLLYSYNQIKELCDLYEEDDV